jgi:hypothetical protein
MKPIALQHLRFRFEHPAREEPSWKSIVERWYQLDAFAYGLAQAYVAWKPKLSPTHPALLLLASPGASNATDMEFARSGAQSPAKFVHTLPNVRCSSLCQVMEWAGPVLCVQKDPATQIHALREAAALLDVGREGPIWVLSVFGVSAGAPAYQAHVFVLGGDSGSLRVTRAETGSGPSLLASTKAKDDAALHAWLEQPQGALALPGNYELTLRESL